MANTLQPEDAEGRQPPLPCIEATELILRSADRAFHDVRRLAHVLSGVNLDSRREDLLDYIRLNRARFIKVYATISWLSGGHGELVANAGNALADSRFQREQIDTCQDQLFFMHGALFRARQRMYDVPVAVDVLVGGKYPRLPKGIEYCGGDVDPRPIFELPANRLEILPRVDRAIRLALLRRGGVPSQFTTHVVSNGILTLFVDGEFQVRVTLLEERQDALWTLLGVDIHVHARDGEAITAPAPNARQQRYLYEVVQKAMDTRGGMDSCNHDHEIGSNPLLAAYQVCHDLCSSMVLEILHGQAQKLAARIGGLWATHLEIVFDKEAQVLDLCVWQREFNTGLAGTGREVGIGGVSGLDGDAWLPQYSSEMGLIVNLPPPPAGCRYVRVHRPPDRQRQIVASLGPALERQKSRDLESDMENGQGLDAVPDSLNRFLEDAEVERVGGGVVKGAVDVRADKLSCSRMLLAATRTFAAQKIEALASDVISLAYELGIVRCLIQVTLLGGFTLRISSANGNAAFCVWLEVSVDVKSGRYLVKDSGFVSRKVGTADLVSRLEDALNLLPRSDSQTLGEKITGALSAGRREPSVRNASVRSGQQDLRQHQVRRCMAECFRVLRRGEVEHVMRRVFGLVPHQRWQALLGRVNAGGRAGVPAIVGSAESSFRIATYSLIQQFREYERCRECKGFLMSDEWRRGRLGPGGSDTGSKSALTTARLPGDVIGPGLSSKDPSLSTHPEVLPTVAASVVDNSNGGEVSASQPLRVGPACSSHTCQLRAEWSEVLSFFLEISIAENLELEVTLLVAGRPSNGPGRCSLRQTVGETYPLQVQVMPCSTRSSHLPTEVPTQNSQRFRMLGKRSASHMADGQGVGLMGTTDGASPTASPGKSSTLSIATPPQLARPDSRWQLDDVSKLSKVELLGHKGIEAELYTAVRMAKLFIPFARLQHALRTLTVGTSLSLDIQGLTNSLKHIVEPPSCAVDLFFGTEEGWSSPEVAAELAKVTFYDGHVESDCWEWDVTLGPNTMIMDYGDLDYGSGEAASLHRRRAALECVQDVLPLVQHIVVVALKAPKSKGANDCENVLGKHLKFRFPSLFSVRSMCRSFAMSGKGLASMQTLAAQASDLQRSEGFDSGMGYVVLSCSPIHVAMHDPCSHHVVVLTHTAFSAERFASQERPGLVLIPLRDHVPTCPAAMKELQAAVSKHRDLRSLLHGLSRTIPVLAAVSRVVPGIASVAAGAAAVSFGLSQNRSMTEEMFVLAPVSPACFVLSARPKTEKRPPLTLIIEAGGHVRVAGLLDRKEDVVVNTAVLQDLLLEWIATGST